MKRLNNALTKQENNFKHQDEQWNDSDYIKSMKGGGSFITSYKALNRENDRFQGGVNRSVDITA